MKTKTAKVTKPKKVKEASQQIHIRLKKSVLKTVDSYCEAHGIVRNAYLVDAVLRKLNSDLKK